MRKAYLFIYDNQVGEREKVKSTIETMSYVLTWRFDMPNMFYIVSEHSAEQLYQQFASINGTNGRFMFIEASTNRQGQMLPDTWYLLTHKYHKPKE